MSDSEDSPEGTGGPQWLRGPQTSVASPAAMPGYDPAAGPAAHEEPFAARYSRTGTTPIPFMVVSFIAMAAAWWALDWSKLARGATDPVLSSEWLYNVTAVLLPGEPSRIAAYSTTRMWVAIGLLVLAALLVALWIGRIGTNLRAGQAPFGTLIPLLAFPAWWLLPITIASTGRGTPSDADLMIRYLVAFGILVSQFLLLRWPTLNRIWRAGRLRYDMASIVLWLPNFIPWAMIFLSTTYMYLVINDSRDLDKVAWYPTDTMYDWARWTSRASAVGILVLLVVVSFCQHVGMAKDRADDAARRLR